MAYDSRNLFIPKVVLMPNIKGISTDKDGNISITQADSAKYNLARTDLASSIEDKDTGTSLKDKQDFDVYTHCYEDLSMKNTKRTAVLIANKGFSPPKEWWINKIVAKEI